MTDLTALPEATPAWWLHWLNLAIAAASFVGVAVHPGWHPPAVLVETVGPLAIVLAVGSGAVFAVLHHKTSQTNLSAAYAYVTRSGTELVAAARQLAPLIDRYPAVESRLTALETAPAPAAAPLPDSVQALVAALQGGRLPQAAQTASAAPGAP